jgi:hypothetical protein
MGKFLMGSFRRLKQVITVKARRRFRVPLPRPINTEKTTAERIYGKK